MRTTYSAPGVYVEEIPSSRQPIAPVGTNTVGFIGVAPDEIQYPVPNDEYDPVLAEKAKENAGKGAAPPDNQEAQRAKDKVAGLEKRRDDIEKSLKDLEPELAADPQDKKKQDQKNRLTQDQKNVLQQLEDAKKAADAANAPKKVEDNLKPYKSEFEKFKIAPAGDAKLCTNFTEYSDRFGSFSADDPKFAGHRALTHAVYGFFQNGGSRCYVVRVKSDSGADIDKALREFESIDEIAIVAAPGMGKKEIWEKLVAHCEAMDDRFAILDTQEVVGTDDELDEKLLSYDTTPNLLPSRAKNAAVYFPYIEVIDPAKQLQDRDPMRDVAAKHRGKVYVAPSGHVAGIYARVDTQRGVHKAPANEAILGAMDVKYYIGKAKQELLNPRGVNCIRNLNGNITVYGARTVGGDKNGEWKYVNVRRVLLFLKESIDEGTQWVVFEPNDPSLWAKIVLNVSAFLTIVWRSGALVGLTPEEAFYVKCDAELNPPEVRDLGQVITEIGVAIVRPAEFVIFRISQWSGPQGS